MEIADVVPVSDGFRPDQGVAHQFLLGEVCFAEMRHQMKAPLSAGHGTDRALGIRDRALRHAHIIRKAVLPVLGIVGEDRITLQPVPC